MESFVMLNFGEAEQELLELETQIYSQYTKKEEVKYHQTGYSPKDSWLLYCLDNLLIPTKATISYLI